MPFEIKEHPIYTSILYAIGTDPFGEKYTAELADLSIIITNVPEEHKTKKITISSALKTLKNENYIKQILDGNSYYFQITNKGKEYIIDSLNN